MTVLFGLVGAAGYIAPRHMKAIKETGNRLAVAMDVNDSIGIIDSYFPDAEFFTDVGRFDRFLHKTNGAAKADERIDYIGICSPNHLHDFHIRQALSAGAHAICEKPVVLNPWNLDALLEDEKKYERKVNTILQLRLHPSIIALKERIDAAPTDAKHDVDLTYITSRGKWYLHSWKGQEEQSGGIATNIGVHFFDMLSFVFGPLQDIKLHHYQPQKASGFLEYEKARVRWFLSIDRNDLPRQAVDAGKPTYRAIHIDGEELEFSEGFTDLHTISYQKILDGQGFSLEEARSSIEAVSAIRNYSGDIRPDDFAHPMLAR